MHAWRDFFIDVGDFTCLAGEIVSRRETPSQCGRLEALQYIFMSFIHLDMLLYCTYHF